MTANDHEAEGREAECPDCGDDLNARPPQSEYGFPVSGRPRWYCPSCQAEKVPKSESGGDA